MQEILQKRISILKQGPVGKGPIVYWMSRDQRVDDNWALLCAQEFALREKVPLTVLFCLAPRFLNATTGQYAFMLAGLRGLSRRLAKLSIPFFLVTGEPDKTLMQFIKTYKASILITDFDPLRIKRQWKEKVTRKIVIPFYEVDAHNIVPCTIASPKQEYGAYTIRKKIGRLLPVFLDTLPKIQKHPFPWTKDLPRIEWEKLPASFKDNSTIGNYEWITPGENEAQKSLTHFISEKLAFYDAGRNDPTEEAQSDLSPYLHFGQLSAQRVALEIEKSDIVSPMKASFIEELIVRRELSDNFCYYNPHYDSFNGFPQWAQKTLNEHRKDRRDYLYGLEQFETARTHDELWNTAQIEMIKRGKMHGYVRMYWAKKILEWTQSPEEAMEIAIYLNNRYELDGRDPNGYAGIAWSIGGVHDRAWNERNVFGKIRYMSYNGCKSKFNIKAYIEKVKSL